MSQSVLNDAQGGRDFCPHKLSQGQYLTGVGKLQKFITQGLFLPKTAFLVAIQSVKQDMLSVLRTVKYTVMFFNRFISWH